MRFCVSWEINGRESFVLPANPSLNGQWGCLVSRFLAAPWEPPEDPKKSNITVDEGKGRICFFSPFLTFFF